MCDTRFRGRTPSGGFVFGSLIVFPDMDCFICTPNADNTLDKHFVLPETVSRDTGIKDKNGRPIFDSDRVVVPMYRPERNEPNFMKGTVEWRNGAFHVKWDAEMYGRHFLGYLEDVELITEEEEEVE